MSSALARTADLQHVFFFMLVTAVMREDRDPIVLEISEEWDTAISCVKWFF